MMIYSYAQQILNLYVAWKSTESVDWDRMSDIQINQQKARVKKSRDAYDAAVTDYLREMVKDIAADKIAGKV